MPQTDEPPEEALKRLDERLDKAEAERASVASATAQRAMGQGYRFLSEVVGGVLGGLGFGWLVDRIAHTQPFGLIGGLLIGVGVSTFVAIRGAGRWAKAESERLGEPPGGAGPEDDLRR
jgi:ATP synthase protein I